MIVWAKKLYFSNNIRKSHKRLMKRVEANKLTFDLYCITYAENEQNLLDIIPVKELKFPHYRRISLTVIGLAKGAEEAKELVARMIGEMYQETGDFRIKEYFT